MGQVRDYEALIDELLLGVEGGWGYGDVTIWLWNVDEEDLTIWLREFAKGLSLDRDRELIEQLKLLGKMTPGKLASEALMIVARLDKYYEQSSELLNHEAWISTGIDLFEQGLYEKAIDCFDRAIEINPDLDEALYKRGIALDNLGRYAEAITSFDREIEINPDLHQAWYSRGITLGNLGRYAEAIASYDRAIKIKTDYHKAWYNRGSDLLKLGRPEEAISSYDQAIEIKIDYHEAWCNRGIALGNLGRYEEAISSFDRAIEINPDEHEYWESRGIALGNLGRHEEAISSFDRAIEINSDEHEYWFNRGIALLKLGQYEDEIASYDRAIEINPDKHEYWFNRGIALDTLGRYEDEIASYDRAIEINPDEHDYWYNRGIALGNLGRHEEAISSFDRAIEINPDKHEYWYNRGNALLKLGQYEEAISSYDRAIEINPDKHKAWCGRGGSLVQLERYEEAITSYERAIEINPDSHEYWFNRCVVFGSRSHKAEIEAYQEAFQHIHPETHSEGWGFLQQKIGRTYYNEGNNQLLNHQRSPQDYYNRAITSYKEALTTLTREQFPKLRLETLIDTAKAYLAQKNPSAARECQTEALTIWLELIDAQASPQGKKRLYIEYSYLLRTQVDLSILDGEPIRALEIAEFDKNKHLEWFLCAQEQQGQTASLILKQIEQLRLNVFGLQYSQMRQLLTPNQAIIYWHLSPDHLTTFILPPNKPNPEILTSSSQQLRDWLKNYDTANLDTINWQELCNILQVSEINRHLDGIEHLILIPHRDLHRLPLHIYWSNLTTTYLPSIQVWLNLKKKPQPDRSAGFLLVESPDYSQATKLKSITKSFDPLTNPKVESAIIAYLFQPKTTIPTGAVKKETLCAAFNTPHTYGHFNGHAFHDSRRPQDSSLVIDGGELTCQDLAQIDLTPYYLISLSACETGITAHQSIDTEYVGLVSAFLSRGTSYVVSTLWSVKDLPSSLLMMTFYLYIKQGNSAPLALYKAAHWLKNLTYAEEAQFHQNVYQRLPQNSESEQTTARTADRNCKIAEKNAKENPAGKPYSEPKYWAAFTISGWG